MTRPHKLAMLMLMSVASATFAMAQTTMPPSSTTQPSDTSTSHQKQAMHDQAMKDCMKTEHDKDASLSKDQLMKTCKEQLKMQQPR